MNEEILVSICIPTYKREEIVRQTLKSIFSQGVDASLFEVCITDNSDSDETKNLLEKEFSGILNLHYKKVTCPGFLNSVEALKFGSGKLLKLHNDYSSFKEGTLQKLIDNVKIYEKTRPEIFFGMSSLNNKNVLEFNNFNDFLNNIDYFSTWSSAFAIWKNDFEKLMSSGIEPNYMFPHTTLLFALTDKSSYIVDDYAYVTNLDLKKKGGYNLIDNFVRIYLTMVREDLLDEGHITKKTYKKIQKNIIKFSARWFSTVKFNSDKYYFTFENSNKIIKQVCGVRMMLYYNLLKLYYIIHKFIIKK